MNRESPIACYHMEHQPPSLGYASLYPLRAVIPPGPMIPLGPMMLYFRLLVIAGVVCVLPCKGDDSANAARAEALARTVQAAHTTDLPRINRVEILSLKLSDTDDKSEIPRSELFLVRPASPASNKSSVAIPTTEVSVTSHASGVAAGEDAKRIADDWRSLDFRPNGALCHVPTYGLRFFSGDKLVFSVSVSWKCHNFYMPAIDPQTGQASVVLFGFDDNSAAKKLLNDLRRMVPHPEIRYPRLR